jgi:hypothetical protein
LPERKLQSDKPYDWEGIPGIKEIWADDSWKFFAGDVFEDGRGKIYFAFGAFKTNKTNKRGETVWRIDWVEITKRHPAYAGRRVINLRS